MPLPRAPKTCAVKFETGPRGYGAAVQYTDAVLMYGRCSLNSIPLGIRPSLASKARARARLMRGCAELMRDARRQRRPC
jgi:hypothetical protein